MSSFYSQYISLLHQPKSMLQSYCKLIKMVKFIRVAYLSFISIISHNVETTWNIFKIRAHMIF